MRRLGEFEQLLLFAVLRLGEDAYGARIRAEIEARAGRSPAIGAIYTGLDRLQARGLVSSYVGEATPVRGGRRKKHYRLEPAGAAALHRTWTSLSAMADGIVHRLARLAHAGGRSCARTLREPPAGSSSSSPSPSASSSRETWRRSSPRVRLSARAPPPRGTGVRSWRRCRPSASITFDGESQP